MNCLFTEVCVRINMCLFNASGNSEGSHHYRSKLHEAACLQLARRWDFLVAVLVLLLQQTSCPCPTPSCWSHRPTDLLSLSYSFNSKWGVLVGDVAAAPPHSMRCRSPERSPSSSSDRTFASMYPSRCPTSRNPQTHASANRLTEEVARS